jgi:hypothetical protein
MNQYIKRSKVNNVLKKGVSVLVVSIFLFSCKKKDTFEDIIINKKGEYWAVWPVYDKNEEPPFGGSYYQFYEDKTYTAYDLNDSEGFGQFSILKNKPWSVSKDSFLSYYKARRKIITINPNTIVLSTEDTITGNYFHIILIKEKIDKNHKSTYYYEQKNRTYFGSTYPTVSPKGSEFR